jgi:hypothetical protein
MASIIEHFGSLPDPRREHRKEHKLIDIIFITIAAVICGADDWYEIFIRCWCFVYWLFCVASPTTALSHPMCKKAKLIHFGLVKFC